MEKFIEGAIQCCRLIFGQAILKLLVNNQQIKNLALKEKVRQMQPDIKPEIVHETL